MPTDPLMAFLQRRFPQQGIDVNQSGQLPGQQLATPQLQRALALALQQPAAMTQSRNRPFLTQGQLGQFAGGAGGGGQR